MALARQRLCRHLHPGCAGHAKTCPPDSRNARTDSITAGRGHAIAISDCTRRCRHAAANAYRAPRCRRTAANACRAPRCRHAAANAYRAPRCRRTAANACRAPRCRHAAANAYRAPRYGYATAHTNCTPCDGYAVAKSDAFAANPDSSSDASAATCNRPRLLHRHLVVCRWDESALR